MKPIKFSSSRTVISQIVLFSTSLYLIFWVANRFISDELNLIRIGILGLSIIISCFFIFIAYNLYDLKAFKSDVELSSLFGKRYKLNISDIKPHGQTSFSLTLVDPLSFTKLTKLGFTVDQKKWVFILNPTIFSSSNDIEKLIEDIRKKHGH